MAVAAAAMRASGLLVLALWLGAGLTLTAPGSGSAADRRRLSPRWVPCVLEGPGQWGRRVSLPPSRPQCCSVGLTGSGLLGPSSCDPVNHALESVVGTEGMGYGLGQ